MLSLFGLAESNYKDGKIDEMILNYKPFMMTKALIFIIETCLEFKRIKDDSSHLIRRLLLDQY